jgi:hypothetical protein
MAKSKTQAQAERAERSKENSAKAHKANEPMKKAREVRKETLDAQAKEEREAEINRGVEDEKAQPKKAEKPHMLDGKPGSGSGLKPGDLFAPKSNPGAAARVPSQPLQPESLQSHGLGILYDKDLDNPPFDTGDPEVTDRGPFGIKDEEATDEEARKAENATSRSKQHDPDNPAIGARGLKDATASPNRIGSKSRKSDTAGGSNSGSGLG